MVPAQKTGSNMLLLDERYDSRGVEIGHQIDLRTVAELAITVPHDQYSCSASHLMRRGGKIAREPKERLGSPL